MEDDRSCEQGESSGTSQISPQEARIQALRDIIHRGRKTKNLAVKMEEPLLEDPYQKTYEIQNVVRGDTLYGYVESELHYSPWDPDYPENPARSQTVHKAIEGLGGRVKTITEQEKVDLLDKEMLTLAHSVKHIDLVRSLCEKESETDAQAYDSIYYNGEHSYKSAIRAAHMTVSMAKLVAEGKYYNGFANVRPPGHHASNDNPNGYCFFNNVAIAARYLLNQKLANKILIVDYDVHHGQGTQRAFYESDKVLYFSIHRYENGTFWPNLEEGNFHYVGDKEGRGYNINVPLNETGLTDFDYLAIITNILLPIAYEFNPSFILISAGYDASLGCPEGQMKVTPAFYSHLIHLLSGLANGKILAVLEGGYYLPSLAEGALQTVKALLNDPAPPLDYHCEINGSVIDTINNLKVAHRPFWKCLKQVNPITEVSDVLNYDRYNNHVAVVKYFGEVPTAPFLTVDCYPKNSPSTYKMFESILSCYKEIYPKCQTSIGVSENGIAELHNTANQAGHETQKRLIGIHNKLREFNLYEQLVKCSFGDPGKLSLGDQDHPILEDVREMMTLTHTKEFLEMLATKGPAEKLDLYWTEHSQLVCQYSCANLFSLVSQIRSGIITHGVGLVRPPGHHAKSDAANGFCLINNVVVTANYALNKLNFKKILILDFDVHHGDGTQQLTYSRNDIMYISMHRYEGASFFPKDQRGNFMYIGKEAAAGYNLNIAFEKAKMGNADYLYTWLKVVVPMAYTYGPDLILVSAGFDAGINDPLGNYTVDPEVFGHMIQTVKSVAPTILVLEGGYNVETTSLGMVNCCRSLLGHPIPMPNLGNVSPEAASAMQNSINSIKPYWPIMTINKKLDPKIIHQRDVDALTSKVGQVKLGD